MMGKTHAAVGSAAAVLILNSNNLTDLALAGAFGAVGGLLCDIDVKSSIGRRNLTTALKLAAGMCISFGVISLVRRENLFASVFDGIGMLKVVMAFILLGCLVYGANTPHRTFTHSLEFSMLVYISLVCVYRAVSLPVLIGIVSHIIIDLLNEKKVSVLYVLHVRFCLGLVPASGKSNKIMGQLALVILVAACVYRVACMPSLL